MLFPHSSVFRTNLRRQQRSVTTGVLSLVIGIMCWKSLGVGFLATNRSVRLLCLVFSFTRLPWETRVQC